MAKGKTRKWGGAPLWGWAIIVAGTIIIVVLLAVSATRSSPSAGSYLPPEPTRPSLSERNAPPAPMIELPSNARAVFLGDSWTEGYGTRPLTGGYAYRTAAAMGWQPNVFGVGGTGYVATRKDQSGRQIAGNYAQRISEIPPQFVAQHIIILQGTTNDYPYAGVIKPAILAAFSAARSRFPGASIVVLGPCPSKFPADPRITTLDDWLALESRGASVHYVSCLKGNWFSADNYGEYYDPKLLHLNAAGYQYMADRLVAELRKFISIAK